jgi:Leukotriene A4 hydrolase, C-terminal
LEWAQRVWLSSTELVPAANKLLKQRTKNSKYTPLPLYYPLFVSFITHCTSSTSLSLLLFRVLQDVLQEFRKWLKVNSMSTKKPSKNNNGSNTALVINNNNHWGNSEFVMLLSMLLYDMPEIPATNRKRSLTYPIAFILLLTLIPLRHDTTLSLATIENLEATYHFSSLQHNTDVAHLWAALLVRNRCAARYHEVRRFLTHHREAMGIFLYHST